MCPRLGYWSRGNPRESREYIASREGQREVMRILRPFLSTTFRNLIFRLTRLSMYELMKRYNRWLVITAVTAPAVAAELSLVSLAVVGRTLLPSEQSFTAGTTTVRFGRHRSAITMAFTIRPRRSHDLWYYAPVGVRWLNAEDWDPTRVCAENQAVL